MNKQRERLVELFEQLEDPSSTCPRMGTSKGCEGCKYLKGDGCDLTGRFVDYILADGWMRPPVKVGQSFWHIEEYTHELLPDEYPTVKVVCESKVEKIFIEKYGNSFGDTRKSFSFRDIGKTVFLTKEESEKALGGVQ